MITPLLTPPRTFSALIFDCDGTLADNLPAHYQAWVDTLNQYDVKMTLERFHALTGMSTADIVLTLNKECGSRLDAQAVGEAKERRYTELVCRVTEVKLVADIAREYHGKVPLAVASGSGRSQVCATLKQLGLYELFDTIVTSDDVVNNKPFPDIFLVTASRLKMAPADCVVYEDSNSGIEAAGRAGMRAIDIRLLYSYDPVARYKWRESK